MSRLAILLVLVAGCAKSEATKQHQADKCWLRYGTERMDVCLRAEYGWSPTEANEAVLRQLQKEQAVQ